MGCLNERILSSYLDKRLSEDERRGIEEHISGCDKCLDLLLLAYKARGPSHKEVSPPELKQKIRRRLGLNQRRPRSELKWLFAAVFLFVLSFIFKRFFLQFLVASAILGFKWAMEGEGAKRVVMIFKGMNKAEKKISPREKIKF